MLIFLHRETSREQQGIFLAGDDVSWTPGWAEGAVHTALNAVWGIVSHLGGASHPDNPGPGDLWALVTTSTPDDIASSTSWDADIVRSVQTVE